MHSRIETDLYAVRCYSNLKLTFTLKENPIFKENKISVVHIHHAHCVFLSKPHFPLITLPHSIFKHSQYNCN